jgi:ribosomal protein S18 acetylase RimI-like enzyme
VSSLGAVVRAVDARLRLATATDAPELARLHRELARVAWDSVPADAEAHLARFLSGAHHSLVILASEDERAVGMAVVHPFPAAAEGTMQLVLDDIYVEANARRRGVGSALVAAVLAGAEALGAPIVHLSTRPENTAARRLFEKHGFVVARDLPYVWERR